MKRGCAPPLCPWYLRDYGRLIHSSQRPLPLRWRSYDRALQSVSPGIFPGVAVLLPERFRVNCAFGGMRCTRSPATGTRTIPKKPPASQPGFRNTPRDCPGAVLMTCNGVVRPAGPRRKSIPRTESGLSATRSVRHSRYFSIQELRLCTRLKTCPCIHPSPVDTHGHSGWPNSNNRRRWPRLFAPRTSSHFCR